MDTAVMKWVASKVDEYGLQTAERVIEIGSYDVNGSVRSLFTGNYLGIDMRKGPGVTVQANGRALPGGNSVFDVVLYLETMEHDFFFWKTFEEMNRVCKPGGHVIVTTRGLHYGRHDYPSDYYRFTDSAIEGMFTAMGWEPLEVTEDDAVMLGSHGVFGIARKT